PPDEVVERARLHLEVVFLARRGQEAPQDAERRERAQPHERAPTARRIDVISRKLSSRDRKSTPRYAPPTTAHPTSVTGLPPAGKTRRSAIPAAIAIGTRTQVPRGMKAPSWRCRSTAVKASPPANASAVARAAAASGSAAPGTANALAAAHRTSVAPTDT